MEKVKRSEYFLNALYMTTLGTKRSSHSLSTATNTSVNYKEVSRLRLTQGTQFGFFVACKSLLLESQLSREIPKLVFPFQFSVTFHYQRILITRQRMHLRRL